MHESLSGDEFRLTVKSQPLNRPSSPVGVRSFLDFIVLSLRPRPFLRARAFMFLHFLTFLYCI